MTATIIAPTVNPGPAAQGQPPNVVTSSSFPFCLDSALQAIAVNSGASLGQPAHARLQLSVDNITWINVDRRTFNAGAGNTSFEVFRLSDYGGKSGNYASGYDSPQSWTNFRLIMGGNIGGSVTISAYGDGACLDSSGGFLAPAFSAFGITGVTSPIEVGSSVSGTKTFTWSTTNSANVAANSIEIDDTTNSVVLGSGLANSGSNALPIGTITSNVAASQLWTIIGKNTLLATFSDTFTLAFEWRVYAGDSSNATLTANQIKALAANSSLQSGFAGSYTIAPSSDYSYFCYPDALGSVNFFKDGNTGFPISMATVADNAAYSNTANGWSYALVSVINAQSVAANYRVYRTQYPFSGTLLMVVS